MCSPFALVFVHEFLQSWQPVSGKAIAHRKCSRGLRTGAMDAYFGFNALLPFLVYVPLLKQEA